MSKSIIIQRIRENLEKGYSFAEARRRVGIRYGNLSAMMLLKDDPEYLDMREVYRQYVNAKKRAGKCYRDFNHAWSEIKGVPPAVEIKPTNDNASLPMGLVN